jgi:hypothetical protein
VGILLLLGRRAAVPPQNLKDILVPLAASFFNLTYNTIHWFPTSVAKKPLFARLASTFHGHRLVSRRHRVVGGPLGHPVSGAFLWRFCRGAEQ